jgi:hypothetical protein
MDLAFWAKYPEGTKNLGRMLLELFGHLHQNKMSSFSAQFGQ